MNKKEMFFEGFRGLLKDRKMMSLSILLVFLGVFVGWLITNLQNLWLSYAVILGYLGVIIASIGGAAYWYYQKETQK